MSDKFFHIKMTQKEIETAIDCVNEGLCYATRRQARSMRDKVKTNLIESMARQQLCANVPIDHIDEHGRVWEYDYCGWWCHDAWQVICEDAYKFALQNIDFNFRKLFDTAIDAMNAAGKGE
jgi:hypothetical protein